MATVKKCPLCPPDENLWDISVEMHCGQWLATEDPILVADSDYRRQCPNCGEAHDLSVDRCGDMSLLEVPMRRRPRPSTVVLQFPWGNETVTRDVVIGRSARSPFGAEIAKTENGGYVSRTHATILFLDGVPMLRAEYSQNSTLLDGEALAPREMRALRDGTTLQLSTRFAAVQIRLQEAE